jgi:hypothetical protein
LAKKLDVVEGIIKSKRTRIAASGKFAHECVIGKKKYSLFTADEWTFLEAGDFVRWEFATKKLGGRGKTYYAISPESIEVLNPAEQAERSSGFVYVLSNASMKGIRKIGFTTNTPMERAAELSSNTAVPTPFSVDWSIAIEGDPALVERSVHARLSSQQQGKEFFRVSADRAKETILAAYRSVYPDAKNQTDQILSKRDQENSKKRDAAIKKLQEERDKVALEASPEYKWKNEGFTNVQLEAGVIPEWKPTSFLSRLKGEIGPDWLKVDVIGRWNKSNDGKPPWTMRAETSINGRINYPQKGRISHIEYFDVRDCISEIMRIRSTHKIALRNITLQIANKLLEDPQLPVGVHPNDAGNYFEVWEKELSRIKFRESENMQYWKNSDKGYFTLAYK